MLNLPKLLRFLLPISAIALVAPGLVSVAVAQEGADAIEEIITTGTRRSARSAADSAVPVDVISGQEFENIDTYVAAADNLNKYISEKLGLGRSYEFGHSFFMKMTDIASRKVVSKKNVQQLFNLHLRPTLKEYLRASYPETELDKVLDEALSKFTDPFK